MVSLNKTVSIEWVGEDALVIPETGNQSQVVRITGSTVGTLRALTRGETVSAQLSEIEELSRYGLVSTERKSGLSRREAISIGGSLGVAGLTVMTLPSAAASLSGEVAALPVPIPVASPTSISPLSNPSHGKITIDDRSGNFTLELPAAHIENYVSIVTAHPTATFEFELATNPAQQFVTTEGGFLKTGLTAPSISTDPDTSGFFVRPAGDADNFLGGSSGFALRIKVGDTVSRWTYELNPPVIFSVRWDGTNFDAG